MCMLFKYRIECIEREKANVSWSLDFFFVFFGKRE